jgi:hypothetical protein
MRACWGGGGRAARRPKAASSPPADLCLLGRRLLRARRRTMPSLLPLPPLQRRCCCCRLVVQPLTRGNHGTQLWLRPRPLLRLRHSMPAAESLTTAQLYARFRLPLGASKSAVKKRYFELAKTSHPDSARGDGDGDANSPSSRSAEHHFVELTEAYQRLLVLAPAKADVTTAGRSQYPVGRRPGAAAAAAAAASRVRGSATSRGPGDPDEHRADAKAAMEAARAEARCGGTASQQHASSLRQPAGGCSRVAASHRAFLTTVDLDLVDRRWQCAELAAGRQARSLQRTGTLSLHAFAGGVCATEPR